MKSSTLRKVLWTVLGSLAVGCQELELSRTGSDTAMGNQAPESSGEVDVSVDDEAGMAWWKLDASLVLHDGVLVSPESTVSVQLLDADLQPLCTADAGLLEAVEQPSPDPMILSWWSVTVDAWAEGCSSDTGVDLVGSLPDLGDLQLGIGSMHTEILALMGSMEDVEPLASSTLNGAYASLDGGAEVYVYGVAGTQDGYAALSGPAAELPLEDGDWQLLAFYPFSL